jgi:nucleoid DNA-binding protein
MTYDEIIEKVAESTGLHKTFVNKVYRAYWKAVKEYIETLPLKEELTDEDFQKLRPNVNIPAIGKFYVTLERYKNKKKYYKINTEDNVAHKKD